MHSFSVLPTSPPVFQTRLDVTPVPKGRPRFSKGGWAYTDKRTKDFEKLCRDHFAGEMAGQPPLEGPLFVNTLVCLKQPKSRADEVHPIGRPDVDNFKGIFDAANEILWLDDAQIVGMLTWKCYAEVPGFEVAVWELGQ